MSGLSTGSRGGSRGGSTRWVVDESDPVAPLWRAAQIYRLLTFLYALGFQIVINDDLTRPGLTWFLFAVLTAANVVWAAGYLFGFGRHWWFVTIEAAVFIAMMLSTLAVASDTWIADNQTWPTTLFASNAVLSAALQGGAVWGALTGFLIGVSSFVVKQQVLLNFGRHATLILLILAGMAVGLGATRARYTHARLVAATQAAAQAEERERLAREVHDGVLQVLALISRRGKEIGGDTAELAHLASVQESRLRALIADGSVVATPTTVGSSETDLAAALRTLADDTVSVSAPADPVELPTERADEIMAAVDNIVENTRHHAGDGARNFILLEDLDDEVVLSVRDDGTGIPVGRLPEAESEGRMGIARSIIGRIEALGGSAKLESAPGAGTEWELTVPKEDS